MWNVIKLKYIFFQFIKELDETLNKSSLAFLTPPPLPHLSLK